MEIRNAANSSADDKFPPRIIVKFQDSYTIPYTDDEDITAFISKNDILPWKQISEKFPGVTITRSFTSVPAEMLSNFVKRALILNSKYQPDQRRPPYQPPNFLSYCTIDCSYDNNEEELLSIIVENKSVETAYFESEHVGVPGVVSSTPVLGTTGSNIRTNEQGYLDPAPTGINARFAWTKRGALGENVKFIDIEQGWHLNHKDIEDARVRLLWGKENPIRKQHGCYVMGVILMQDNDIGGVGITPKVKANVISQISETGHHSIHNAIMHAIAVLDEGDVLLLETQVKDRRTGDKFWPAEIKPIIFHSIELAVACGIIVVEAAGNGRSGDEPQGNDLDDFPIWYGKNVLGRGQEGFRDSGAILVAAVSKNEDHGRIQSSNFGERVDCVAWGEGVFSSSLPTDQYDDLFGGTSSASAIIAGAAISVQSINIEKHGQPLSPSDMRQILSGHGTPSANTKGIMPDLKLIITTVI